MRRTHYVLDSFGALWSGHIEQSDQARIYHAWITNGRDIWRAKSKSVNDLKKWAESIFPNDQKFKWKRITKDYCSCPHCKGH